MPIVPNVTTLDSELSWQSEDGQRKVYKVVFDVDGKQFHAQTFSGIIKEKGWSGDLETYERGKYTYVRQAPKEGQSFGSSKATPAKADNADYSFYLSYGKDIVVALIETSGLTDARLKKAVDSAIQAGKALYESKNEDASPTELADAATEVFGKDVVVEDIGELPVE